MAISRSDSEQGSSNYIKIIFTKYGFLFDRVKENNFFTSLNKCKNIKALTFYDIYVCSLH